MAAHEDIADLNDSANGEGVSAEFIVSKILPSEIPFHNYGIAEHNIDTRNIDISSDNFTNATCTLQKSMEFYKKFVWRLQDNKKLCFKTIDLVVPECSSYQFSEDDEPAKFMENIIQFACRVAEKTDCLVIPAGLGIQTLHNFICERKCFQTIDVSAAEISISFTAADIVLDNSDSNQSSTPKSPLQKLCDVICTFAPAGQDHVAAHHPAMIKLHTTSGRDRIVSSQSVSSTSLKDKLKSINMKCDKCKIFFDDEPILGAAGETQTAVSSSSAADPQTTSFEQPQAIQNPPTETNPTTVDRAVQTETLNAIPPNNQSGFTFDSICADNPTVPPHNAHLRTASRYWQLDAIHKKHSTGAECTIAIIDDGIDPWHPAINQDNILDFQDFSDSSNIYSPTAHGTMCAGIACGKKFSPGQSTFRNGVAPNAKMLLYKVAIEIPDSRNQIYYALNEILKWHITNKRLAGGGAGAGVDVVSLSLGFQFDRRIAKVITKLVNEDVIIVCAASNNGHKSSQPISFPARLGHVLCIGSHGPHGKPSGFSPVGQQIDFLAPGEGITAPASSCQPLTFTKNGTSYATPAVAGLICLILSYIKKHNSPRIVEYFHNHWAMKEILREISTSPGQHAEDRGYGALTPRRFFQQPDRILESIRIYSTL